MLFPASSMFSCSCRAIKTGFVFGFGALSLIEFCFVVFFGCWLLAVCLGAFLTSFWPELNLGCGVGVALTVDTRFGLEQGSEFCWFHLCVHWPRDCCHFIRLGFNFGSSSRSYSCNSCRCNCNFCIIRL